MLTIGLSIPVPDPFARELSEWRRKVNDPQADLVAPHITVVPPTAVDVHTLEWTLSHLDEVCKRHEPFSIHLRGTGSFRPISPVVFVAVAHGISACELLADDVRLGPLSTPRVFPYHPHVTVAHNVSDVLLDQAYEGLATFSAEFVVRRMTMHTQESDGRWQAVRGFDLAAPE